MASPKRDKYRPRGGKMLDENDQTFDLTAWIKSVGVSILVAMKIKDSSGVVIDPATKQNQSEAIGNQTDGDQKTQIVGSDGKVASVRPKINNAGTEDPNGIVVYTEKLKAERTFAGNFLLNETYGSDMNVNVGFSGTPDKIHDGIDNILWTASAILGTWSFNNTTHAKQGAVTVVDYTQLSGATITIQGTNLTDTVLTEGVDWNAATSNNATASSIASAIDAITGVSATAVGSVVNVTADDSVTQADITLFTSSDLTNLPTTAQSVNASLTENGDEALFKRSSSVAMSGFSAITLNVLITKWSVIRDNEIQIRARIAGVDVGNSINLSDFVDETQFGVWQSVAIIKSQFGLDDEDIDEFVVQTISISGEPNAPDYYIDIFQLEESGAPVTFTFAPPVGTTFYTDDTTFEMVAASSDTEPNVSYNKFTDLPRLTIGIQTVIQVGGQILISTGLKSNAEILSLPAINLSVYVDGTDKIFQFRQDTGGTILNGDDGDFIGVTINDDLSALKFFRYFFKGRLEVNEQFSE